MFAVQSSPIDRSIDPKQGTARRHRPIGAKGQSGLRVEQGTEGIGAGAAFSANPSLRPTAVINNVIRLHRSNHSQIVAATVVHGTQVLGMLDPETAVARPVLPRYGLKNI